MKIPWSDFKKFIFGSYGSLLVALLLVIILQPAVDTLVGKYLLEAIFIFILLAGLRAITVNRVLLRFELTLFVVSLALYAAGTLFASVRLVYLGIAGRILFMSLVALTILIQLFRARKVSEDTLAGAVCVYLLIALVWGHCFLLIEFMVPGSFSFTIGEARLQLWVSRDFYPFYYFSLVTMTTIGYGDMVPISTAARTFATVEGVLGQIYLTILVARLVGMHLMQQQKKEE
jgi:hypothetical protein